MAMARFRMVGAGKREFVFATRALTKTGYLAVLKWGICAMCLSMAALGAIVQFHPQGPRGLEARVIHGIVVSSAVGVGLWWLIRPWPSYRSAIAFMIWADVSVITAAALTSTPQARILATIHMGLIGVFAAFLLGSTILMVHCAAATLAITAFTFWAVVSEQATTFGLFIYYAPAFSSVVVLPVVIQAVIEAGRRSIGQVAVQAVRDPLTGLLNRRGMYAAASSTVDPRSLLAIASIDVDRFKQLNDSYGHSVGDAALRQIAGQLSAMVRSADIAARTGGDEFVVIAHLRNRHGLDSFVDRCRKVLTIALDASNLPTTDPSAERGDRVVVSASIGITWGTGADQRSDLASLLHKADSAMYQAKRAGGNSLVVCDPDDPTMQ